MVDALSAFALACNILQVIEYGSKILSKAVEYGRSESGLLVEHQALEVVAADLLAITTDLELSLQASPDTGSRLVHVQKASQECCRVSKDFLGFLERFRTNGDSSLWRRLGKAMKLAWQREKMIAMQQAVAEARNNLQIAFLLYSHLHLQQMISESSSNLEHQMAAAVQRSLSQSAHNRSQTKLHLSDLLEQLTINKVAYDDAAIELERCCKADLSKISSSCATISQKAIAERDAVYDEVVLQARHRALEMLYFEEICDRENHVLDAHQSTFKWAHDMSILPAGRSMTDWLESTSEDDKVFWISGKPGSGKSTLQKYLIKRLLDTDEVSRSSSHPKVIPVKVFFWKPGRPIQRSMEGFFRSILFQLLQGNPKIIDNVIPKPVWDSIYSSISLDLPLSPQGHMSVSDMHLAVKQILLLMDQSSCVVIFLDGLDEFGENPRDRNEILNVLDMLKQFKWVKLICSSRPWIIFRDYFEGVPQLKLEDRTKGDILCYVEDKLQHNFHFRRSCFNNLETAQSLISNIVDNAQGVFLWVYLVVRELLMGAQDGESIRMLRIRFDKIPHDLNEYFRRIMQNIEPQYAREASALMQIQLHHIKFAKSGGLASVQPRLLDVSFLDLGRLDFAQDPEFVPDFSIRERNDCNIMMDLMERRVYSRCVGLLEIRKDSTGDEDTPELPGSTLGPRFEFFHRSFADFLSEEAEEILYTYTDGKFDVSLYRLNAYQVLMDNLDFEWIREQSHLFHHILYEIGIIVNYQPHLMDSMANWVIQSLNRWAEGLFGPIFTDKGRQLMVGIERLLRLWKLSLGTYITEIAVSYGWVPWIEKHVTTDNVRFKHGQPYLFYCVSPAGTEFMRRTSASQKKIEISPQLNHNWYLVVSLLCKKGADPTDLYQYDSVISLLLKHFDKIPQAKTRSGGHMIVDVLTALLTYGVASDISAEFLFNTHSTFMIYHKSEIHDQIVARWSFAECSRNLDRRRLPMYKITSLLASAGLKAFDVQRLEDIIRKRDGPIVVDDIAISTGVGEVSETAANRRHPQSNKRGNMAPPDSSHWHESPTPKK